MIAVLTPEDWQAWREIRLEALLVDTVAFSGSYEVEAARTKPMHRDELNKNIVFAWRDTDGTLGGVLGFYVIPNPKLSHRGLVFGMYVREQYRRRGIAAQLMEAVIAHAKTCVSQLHLAVDTERESAKALYAKFGFETYGRDPRAIAVGDVYYDEFLMVKML